MLRIVIGITLFTAAILLITLTPHTRADGAETPSVVVSPHR